MRASGRFGYQLFSSIYSDQPVDTRWAILQSAFPHFYLAVDMWEVQFRTPGADTIEPQMTTALRYTNYDVAVTATLMMDWDAT